MRSIISFSMALVLLSCAGEPKQKPFQSVTVTPVFEDSVSIRAITFLDSRTLAFAGSNGVYGTVDVNSHKVRANVQIFDSIQPHFRAVGHTSSDFFMLSVESPALLYKTGDQGKMELVYTEDGEGVFYDSLAFWNDTEGIAVGDTVDGCLSIIVTRDGGTSWTKLACSDLPEGIEDEGAFAASNSNIAVQGNKVWIGTTEGRIYYSSDKGMTWEIQETPIVSKEPTQGIYSLDFFDENTGFAIGGDYTQPGSNRANKIKTVDGGKTWQLVANGLEPGYKSCVQFVPNSGGKDLVAVGFTGVSYSFDGGESWQQLSEASFYTLRFLNDSTAYAAGKNRIAQLVFK
ncbi:putative oxidoreductase [Allomuricauda ruestringensis DSM 13258]|uniref:Oxidoreductase n=1 Tax=Allomuricauda ruestringensis (strain DSM 13258 / CIP 107369 / LMG 19739 / B1) TaxID=886377 RepID=G2PQY3_ALLRU|nr:oxidoreductase [Allomuricauda ruestringensis]AEM69147.1 putative oxidoreductase [Allomuricauda ruestringensis DSM 13258]